MDINALRDKFISIYSEKPAIFQSPGRINIIGEHTDYNEGFVLPAAIDKYVYVAISKRSDAEIHLYSVKYNEHVQVDIHSVKKQPQQWANYILGVVNEFQKANFTVGGFNLVLDGNVPGGAGLSSSAALECAVGYALNNIFSLGIDKIALTKFAQKAEHNFAGVMCGIMDQFASVFGKKDHAIKLDCKTHEYEYIPLNLPGFKMVLFNTNVKHNLSDSAYNKRREACYQGVSWIQEAHPEVQSLRDATVVMLDEFVLPKDADIYQKCLYVVEEIERLQLACADLEKGDLVSLGQRMFQTHEGLSKYYEVSCAELDFLVDEVKGNENVLGARMMGGGFGGCTINLVRDEAIDNLVAQTSVAYQNKFGVELGVYIVNIGEGSSTVELPEMQLN